jgi:hypothetical protein
MLKKWNGTILHAIGAETNYQTLFTATNSFTIASVALVVTSIFIFQSETPYHYVVTLYSATAAAMLFVAGSFVAINEIVRSNNETLVLGYTNPTLPQVLTQLMASVFLVGLTDLVIVALQICIVAYETK